MDRNQSIERLPDERNHRLAALRVVVELFLVKPARRNGTRLLSALGPVKARHWLALPNRAAYL